MSQTSRPKANDALPGRWENASPLQKDSTLVADLPSTDILKQEPDVSYLSLYKTDLLDRLLC